MLPPHLPHNMKARPVRLKLMKPAVRLPEVTSPLSRLGVKNIRLRLKRRPSMLKSGLKVLERA